MLCLFQKPISGSCLSQPRTEGRVRLENIGGSVTLRRLGLHCHVASDLVSYPKLAEIAIRYVWKLTQSEMQLKIMDALEKCSTPQMALEWLNKKAGWAPWTIVLLLLPLVADRQRASNARSHCWAKCTAYPHGWKVQCFVSATWLCDSPPCLMRCESCHWVVFICFLGDDGTILYCQDGFFVQSLVSDEDVEGDTAMWVWQWLDRLPFSTSGKMGQEGRKMWCQTFCALSHMLGLIGFIAICTAQTSQFTQSSCHPAGLGAWLLFCLHTGAGHQLWWELF